MNTNLNSEKIDGVIKKNLPAFNTPGAMTVRPGFKMTNGQVTKKPAIVVTVDKKLDGLPAGKKLPAQIGGIPVDVREATGLQRLRAKSPAQFELAKAHMRNELREPDFPFERTIPGGSLLTTAQKSAAPESSPIGTTKEKLTYAAPAGMPLKKFTRNMTLIGFASPDDGFTVLQEFLSQTKNDLTIAMYDFTSADILNEVVSVVKNETVQFKMVLDHPPKNPTANQTDEDTRTDILQADPKAVINWALTRNDPVVNEWIYPTAYHIKVAVRDSAAFMLSSGNYNVSNQPNLAANDPSKGSLANADRDWHVIVMDPEMALLFKAYIDNDFAVAQGGQGTGNAVEHHLINRALDDLQNESSKSSFQQEASASAVPSALGKQKLFSNIPVSIQPLLTPDPGVATTMYVENVVSLINSAKTKVYMQTQYIHPSDATADQGFMQLITALSNAHKKGLEVKVITSQFENTAQWVEKLQEFDLVDGVLKIQNRVHNKGIVVDSSIVMVSSQNWSADGTLRNRDAGLIIQNADVAVYFEDIFLHDWNVNAGVKLVDVSHPLNSAPALLHGSL